MPAPLAALLCLASLTAADPPPVDVPPDPSIPTLIADLRSTSPDPRSRDALHALLSLGEPALVPLYAALDSLDFRQRQLAAAILRAMDGIAIEGENPFSSASPPPKITPTPALLRVCIEGLKDDALPGVVAGEREYDKRPIVYNAAGGTRFLIKHAAAAEPLLAEALKSTDLQQRFCAAIILGFAHRTTHAETICAILIPHLRDNSIPCDALWAAGALYRLGPAADLHLQAAALKPIDKQQRELLALILLDIRQPLKNPAGYGPRTAGKLTTLDLDGAMDPLIAFDQNSLRMDWGSTMTQRNRDTPPQATPKPANIFLNPKRAE